MSHEEIPGSAAEKDEPGGTDGAPAQAAAGDAELDALRAELAAAQAKASENWDRYLREAAEMQNLRKRATEREEKARKFAVDRFASDMLNVRDSLEMGLAAADSEATVEALREGTEATLRQLEQGFEKAGIAVVDPLGAPFDPAHHEAMAMQEVAGLERDEVVTVVQKGYLLHDRLLRPARVIVGRPAPDSGDGGAGGADPGEDTSGEND
jgi:molecular chaperone GrpE